MKISYITSRFPSPSETFIVREIDAVEAQPGVEVELLSLFAPLEGFVHPSARPWMERLRRPEASEALRDVAWWLAHSPIRTTGAIGATIRGYWRNPARCARALVCLAVAASHARRMASDPPDHIHAHFATYPALAAWVCKRLTGVSYSFTAHAHDLYVDQSMLAEKVAEADFVAAISEFNHRFLLDYGGGQSTPVRVVHCGVDPDLFSYEPRPAGTRAACVASLQEHKGHRVLIEAMADPGAPQNLRVQLVGSGPLEQELKVLVSRRGLSERVTFRGPLTEPEVRQVLNSSNLFVLPSLIAKDGQMEGLPVALMEALAAGLVVVASRLSGIPELIIDGETGYLAEPGDPRSLAAALTRAVEGTLEHDLGRRMVEREFDVGGSAAQLTELFRTSVDDA